MNQVLKTATIATVSASEPADFGLLVDKPEGMTSAEVVRRIKRRFGLSQVGHAGTLDPLATGLLVILTGRATRLQEIVLGSDKSYQGEILLGRATDSDDITGRTVAEDLELTAINKNKIDQLLKFAEHKFLGRQLQVPPEYSAVKVNGQRSYALARRGQAVVLAPREIVVSEIKLSAEEWPTIGFSIRCSKGTYIRSLARDLGTFLGVPACIKSLRRTEIGQFALRQSMLLDELLQSVDLRRTAAARSLAQLVEHLPAVRLSDDQCKMFRHGDRRVLAMVDKLEDLGGSARFIAALDGDGTLNGIIARKADDVGYEIRCVLA